MPKQGNTPSRKSGIVGNKNPTITTTSKVPRTSSTTRSQTEQSVSVVSTTSIPITIIPVASTSTVNIPTPITTTNEPNQQLSTDAILGPITQIQESVTNSTVHFPNPRIEDASDENETATINNPFTVEQTPMNLQLTNLTSENISHQMEQLNKNFSLLTQFLVQSQQQTMQLIASLVSNNNQTTQTVVTSVPNHTSNNQTTIVNTSSPSNMIVSQAHTTASSVSSSPIASTTVIPNVVATSTPSSLPTSNIVSTSNSPWSRVPMPKITKAYPEQAFEQLEGWMRVNKIVTDDDRYDTLSLAIDSNIKSTASIPIETPFGQRYEALKEAVLRLFLESERRRMKNIISNLQLGDRKPSELLADMKLQYKGSIVNNPLFQELFMNRLPTAVHPFLIRDMRQEQLSLEELASRADEYCELLPNSQSVNAVNNNPNSLSAMVEKLTRELKELKNNQHRSRSKSRNSRHHSSNKRDSTPGDKKSQSPGSKPCYFHVKFGNNNHENKRCYKRCKFNAQWVATRKARGEEANSDF